VDIVDSMHDTGAKCIGTISDKYSVVDVASSNHDNTIALVA
jgi:hypothetical protein